MTTAGVTISHQTIWQDLLTYVGRMREFGRHEWLIYVFWVGMIGSLAVVTSAFLLIGVGAGAQFPEEAWMVPMGAAIFTGAIAIDTVGHLTVYREVIREQGEQLVHRITIFNGIASCLALSAAYQWPRLLWIPAMVFTGLSFLYSLVDEFLHWRRYLTQGSDRIEMSSHVGILTGHTIMMIGWWSWFFGGYQGVAATLPALGLG